MDIKWIEGQAAGLDQFVQGYKACLQEVAAQLNREMPKKIDSDKLTELQKAYQADKCD